MTSILMVHGVGCGGEVWDAMRPQFEGAGFTCEAPTLFPDRRRVDDPPETLGTLTLKDYVDAMARKARDMTTDGQRPVVIGHSMGGLIAQKLAERGEVSAAVFLTPAAPLGCQVNDVRPLRTFWSVVTIGQKKLPGRAVKVGPNGFRWGVLNKVPADRHAELYAAARFDSGQVYVDLLNPQPIEEGRVRVPTLTIGATRDRATVISSVRKIGQKYARAATPGDYLEYPDHAHWILDEPGTPSVTADIITWLGRKVSA